MCFEFYHGLADISKFYPSLMARDKILISANPCFSQKITKNVLLGLLTFYVVGTHQNFIIQGSLLS
jgi:hypothetical protein